MSNLTYPLITRPGGPSAKNARQAGAPNTQPSEGTTLMVNTIPEGDAPSVAQIQSYLVAHSDRWLITYPHMSISYGALAELVHQLLTVHGTVARTVNAELVRETVTLEQQAATLRAEVARLAAELRQAYRNTGAYLSSENRLRVQRAALWDLLKRQTRVVVDQRRAYAADYNAHNDTVCELLAELEKAERAGGGVG